jgi:hypothetical protein
MIVKNDVGPVCTLDSVDWETIIKARPNVLLHGERPITAACLVAMEPHCSAPIVRLQSPGSWSLSDISEGSVVFENAAACGLVEQRRMLEWLDNCGYRVQLITTTNRPLFDLVGRGRFLEKLFYRLNIVYLDLARAALEQPVVM